MKKLIILLFAIVAMVGCTGGNDTPVVLNDDGIAGFDDQDIIQYLDVRSNPNKQIAHYVTARKFYDYLAYGSYIDSLKVKYLEADEVLFDDLEMDSLHLIGSLTVDKKTLLNDALIVNNWVEMGRDLTFVNPQSYVKFNGTDGENYIEFNGETADKITFNGDASEFNMLGGNNIIAIGDNSTITTGASTIVNTGANSSITMPSNSSITLGTTTNSAATLNFLGDADGIYFKSVLGNNPNGIYFASKGELKFYNTGKITLNGDNSLIESNSSNGSISFTGASSSFTVEGAGGLTVGRDEITSKIYLTEGNLTVAKGNINIPYDEGEINLEGTDGAINLTGVRSLINLTGTDSGVTINGTGGISLDAGDANSDITINNGNITIAKGDITLSNGNIFAYSDKRLKDDITKLPSLLNSISTIDVVSFYYKDDLKRANPRKQLGVIADSFANAGYPYSLAVSTKGDYYVVDYTKVGVIALAVAKELAAENVELKKELSALGKRIAALEKK